MTIFIKKDSTLPEVKFPLSQWLMEKLDITPEMMENVAVTFSMIDANSGNYRIANKEAKLLIVDNIYEKLDETKYTLSYKMSLKDTKKEGRYFGEFVIDFLGDNKCGKLKLPLDDTIQIIIGDSITKTDVI